MLQGFQVVIEIVVKQRCTPKPAMPINPVLLTGWGAEFALDDSHQTENGGFVDAFFFTGQQCNDIPMR